MRILLLLAGFVLLNGVCAKPILGVYTGGGNPNLMKAFGQFAGHNASLALDFLSLNDWPGLRGDATQFQAWAAWLNAQNDRWFVLSIAMIPLNGGGDLGTGASGGYDSTWEALGASLVQNGLHTRVILRIGWEFNGSWYPWYAGKNPTAWIQYFQRIVNILKKHGPEFKVLWNLQVNWTPLDPTTVWPGGQYVDYIGIDVYDTCYDSKVGCTAYLSNRPEGGTWDSRVRYPANTLVDWNGAFYVNSQDSQGKQPDTGAPWSQAFPASTVQASREATWNNLVNGYDGLAGWAAWAQKQGKPLAIGEMGVFLTQNGGGDDPYYIEQMYNWVTNPANNVAWISYWDYGEQQLSPKDGFQPSKNAAAAFKRTFGTL